MPSVRSMHSGELPPCPSAYQQAAMADPKLPEIHLGMGLTLLQLKRFDEALAQINLELSLVREQNGCRYETRIEAENTASH